MKQQENKNVTSMCEERREKKSETEFGRQCDRAEFGRGQPRHFGTRDKDVV